jgi:hypothetical protein
MFSRDTNSWLGRRLILPNLLGSGDKVLSYSVEVDGPFVTEHVCQRDEMIRGWEKLMDHRLALQLIVKIELFIDDTVTQVIVGDSQPAHIASLQATATGLDGQTASRIIHECKVTEAMARTCGPIELGPDISPVPLDVNVDLFFRVIDRAVSSLQALSL